MTQKKMLVAKPEPDLHLGPTGLEWLTWSCQVSCIVRSHWAESCPTCPHQGIAAVPRGPGVLGWARPWGSVQFLLCLSKACSPLPLSAQLISITNNTAQRGLWRGELYHSPDSVAGCSGHGIDLQLPRLPPQMHHWGSQAASKQQDFR